MTKKEYEKLRTLLYSQCRAYEDFAQGESVMRLEDDVYVSEAWWQFVLVTERNQVLFVLIDYYSDYPLGGLSVNSRSTEALLKHWNRLLDEGADCIYYTTVDKGE